jgi:small subunit ribosomal protein S17
MPKKILSGLVVSAKAEKTIIVKVERSFMHPTYKKNVRKSKRYAVHSPENAIKEGDFVTIIESRPLSKTKKWEVLGSV